jgi:putative peptide zinc metalloprotease protein
VSSPLFFILKFSKLQEADRVQNSDGNLTIRLAPHRIIPDKEHYIVEHLLTGEFYEMPRPAVDALEAFAKGIPPEQVELDLINKYPDEEIDMMDFLSQLNEMGFLISENEMLREVDEFDRNNVNNSLIYHYSRISQLLFHKRVIPIYVVFLCANILFFVWRPDLFPRPLDLFPFDSMVMNIVVSLMVSMALLAIHENGHVLAARAFGLTTTVRLNHRLFLIVLETEMPTIWRLPRNKRNIPLLAGLFMEHTLLILSLFTLTFVPSLTPAIVGILGVIVLHLVMMSIYQCMFFMKTDLYYVFQNVSGSYNLLENAGGWLKDKIPFIRPKNTSIMYDKDRNVVRGYAVFYACGLVASGAVVVFYIIPQFVFAFTTSFDRLIYPTSTAMKTDAILFFAQFSVILGLLAYSWSKKFMRTRRS